MDSHSRNNTHLIQTPERNSIFANIHQIDINYFVLHFYVLIDLLKCLQSISIIDIIVIRKNTKEGGMIPRITKRTHPLTEFKQNSCKLYTLYLAVSLSCHLKYFYKSHAKFNNNSLFQLKK